MALEWCKAKAYAIIILIYTYSKVNVAIGLINLSEIIALQEELVHKVGVHFRVCLWRHQILRKYGDCMDYL